MKESCTFVIINFVIINLVWETICIITRLSWDIGNFNGNVSFFSLALRTNKLPSFGFYKRLLAYNVQTRSD